MKKVLLIATTALALAAGSAIADDKNRITKTYDLDGFDEIDVSGVYDIDVTVGEDFSFEISGPAKEMERVEFETRKGVLHLGHRERKRNEKKIRNRKGLDARITLPVLYAISVSGVVDADITGVTAENFDFNLSGVGDVDLSGSCGSLKAKISGVGDFDARSFKCSTVDVSVSGVGDAEVFAKDAVKANASGMGDISVYGKPGDVEANDSFLSDITIH